MAGERHIEIFRYLPDGTNVPKADSSNDSDSQHTRTIGPRGRFRKTCGVPLSAKGGVNLKQESPGRDQFYET
jgi:hypothetical protein